MKYTKKLYYADFTSGKFARPRNPLLRFISDFFLSLWYLGLFLVVCIFYPTALFADSYRYLKLQYLRLNSENNRKDFQHKINMSFQNMRNLLTN